jgi:hypothetical protein
MRSKDGTTIPGAKTPGFGMVPGRRRSAPGLGFAPRLHGLPGRPTVRSAVVSGGPADCLDNS